MVQQTQYSGKKPHVWHLFFLAIPLILANITASLLGLVDSAILGYMDATHYLAGASIGTLILTQLYWICGFLKMSTTGLSAQAGRSNVDVLQQERRTKVLVQGVLHCCSVIRQFAPPRPVVLAGDCGHGCQRPVDEQLCSHGGCHEWLLSPTSHPPR